MDHFFAAMQPYFLEILGLIITALLGAAVKFAKDRFGIEIEARHRDALQSALMTGVRLALQRLGHGASQRDIINAAVAYAHQSVPDAIQKLGPSVDLLGQIATSKLAEAAKQ